jgi:hypothetical protein
VLRKTRDDWAFLLSLWEKSRKVVGSSFLVSHSSRKLRSAWVQKGGRHHRAAFCEIAMAMQAGRPAMGNGKELARARGVALVTPTTTVILSLEN